MKILLAIDGSKCSEIALNEVVRRPWPAASEIKVISVVAPSIYFTPEPWPGSQEYFAKVDKLEHEKAETVIRNAVLKLAVTAEVSLKISSDVVDGLPKQRIVEEAERWNADLVVVGSHGSGSWNRFLLGSVSQAVSLHASCSVEIVRCRAENATETGGSGKS